MEESYPPIRLAEERYEAGNYQIIVNPLTSGYTVHIGCQSFAIESTETLILRLSAYLRNPQEVMDQWLNHKVLPE